MVTNSHIGVKRMGELDNKPFHEAIKRKYSEVEADDRASEICSLWEEYLRDPEWHPFKVITEDGQHLVYSHLSQLYLYVDYVMVNSITLG